MFNGRFTVEAISHRKYLLIQKVSADHTTTNIIYEFDSIWTGIMHVPLWMIYEDLFCVAFSILNILV